MVLGVWAHGLIYWDLSRLTTPTLCPLKSEYIQCLLSQEKQLQIGHIWCLMTNTNVFTKDPDAVLDYRWDWSEWLETGETITSAVVTVPEGITKDSQDDTGETVTVWLSGGTVETGYQIICHITTSEAREDDRSIYIRCQER
jgi:hypothetical protein